jgi:bacillithiol system protein YtxJ
MFEITTNLNTILDSSDKETVYIFKHSMTCSVSASAYEEVEKLIEENNPKVFLVIVQKERDFSNKIEDYFKITHESPQLIAIKNRKPIYDLDHSKIKLEKIKNV